MDEFRKQVQDRFGDLAGAFFKLYPFGSQAEAGIAQKASARDRGLVSMYLWAASAGKDREDGSLHLLLDHAEPGPDSERFGAFHTSEVPYVFNTLNMSKRPWTDDDYRLARTMALTDQLHDRWQPEWEGTPAGRPFEWMRQHDGNRRQDRSRSVADKAKIDFYGLTSRARATAR